MTEPTEEGPYVLARTRVNERGFREFHFGEFPYVHRSLGGADQEARRLVRTTEEDFTIFKKEYTVALEVLETETFSVDKDQLADQLAKEIRDLGLSIDLATAQKLVVRSLKSCG